MIKANAGLLNQEDLNAGPANRYPRPEQLEPNDYVERSRRIQRNDFENIPAFLACGVIFVASAPPALLANVLLFAFVVAHLAHTVAYTSKQWHELRTALYSVGSIAVIIMAVYALAVTIF